MFVGHDFGHIAQVQSQPRIGHAQGQSGGFDVVHALQYDRHAPGASLIIGYFSAGVALDEEIDFRCVQLAAITFFGDNVNSAHIKYL